MTMEGIASGPFGRCVPWLGGPFPHVADHVVESVAVGREGPTGDVRSWPLLHRSQGNWLSQVFAMRRPPGVNSSPQVSSGQSRARAPSICSCPRTQMNDRTPSR